MTTSLDRAGFGAAITPVERGRLSDEVARRIAWSIQHRQYGAGDRLPSMAAMARGFGVAISTVREGLTKLEWMGMIEVRHGSGAFVCSGPPSGAGAAR